MSVQGFIFYLRDDLHIKDDTNILAAVLGYKYGASDHDYKLQHPQKGDIFENIITKHTYRFDGERWVEEE